MKTRLFLLRPCLSIGFATCGAIVLCACDSSGGRNDKTPGNQTPSQSASLPPQSGDTYLATLIDHVEFHEFKAMDIPLAEVFQMIEEKLNKAASPEKVKIVTVNSTKERILIVLRRARVRDLLNLIERQTNYHYRLDEKNLIIEYFYSGDLIE
jgi:hypothetical protein